MKQRQPVGSVYQDMADPCRIGLPVEVIEMPTIKVEQSLLKKLQQRHGIENKPELMAEQLPLLGTDIDRCDDEMLEIEIFPDRPDLLSGETLAHAIRLLGADLLIFQYLFAATITKNFLSFQEIVLISCSRLKLGKYNA